MPNHGDIVQAVWNEQPPEHTLAGALAFLLRLLPRLPANEAAGLLLKDAGENIIPFNGQLVSAGRICYPSGEIVKVLTDVPTTNGPSWQDDGLVDPSRYLAVEQEPQKESEKEPDKEPPPVVDLSVVHAKLDAVLAALTALQAKKAPILRATDDAKLFGMTIFRKGQAVLTPEEP